MGITGFVSEIKRVENYPDFEKSVHVIQHGAQGEEPITRSLQLPILLSGVFTDRSIFSLNLSHIQIPK